VADQDDVVEPVDRRIHDILVHIAETSSDDSQRALARDLMLTLPPVKHWPEHTVGALYERFAFARIRNSFH
jgi:hypothetical protein